MPQVSYRRLSKTTWNKIWEIFASTLARSNQKSSSVLLSGLLTKAEETMLAKRLVAYFMLILNYAPTEIARELKLSTSTLYKFQEILENNNPYRSELAKLIPKDFTLTKQNINQSLSIIDRAILGYRDRHLLRV